MSITLVYDRRFIRCNTGTENLYIPLALYGSSNCTQINPRTGREVLERDWSLFSFGDDMVLGTPELILAKAEQFKSAEFRYRGQWVRDVPKWFRNGIKDAITMEEIIEQKGWSWDLHVCLSLYDGPDGTRSKTMKDQYIASTAELIDWVREAKEEKLNLLSDGWRAAYLHIGFDSDEPMRITPSLNLNRPVIAKTRSGYIRAVTDGGKTVSYTNSIAEAMIFNNGEDLIASVPAWIREHRPIQIVSAAKAAKARSAGEYVLRFGTNFAAKKTRTKLYFSWTEAGAKHFVSEKDAQRWYDEKIKGRFSSLQAPEIVFIGKGQEES